MMIRIDGTLLVFDSIANRSSFSYRNPYVCGSIHSGAKFYTAWWNASERPQFKSDQNWSYFVSGKGVRNIGNTQAQPRNEKVKDGRARDAALVATSPLSHREEHTKRPVYILNQ